LLHSGTAPPAASSGTRRLLERLLVTGCSMLTAYSLFSGAGGCSLGLRQAGFDVKLAADIDPSACATYAANLGSGPVWRVDLSTADAAALVAHAAPPATPVDLIVGGPPCQGFSSAGARDWADPRNTLLRRFVEVVESV